MSRDGKVLFTVVLILASIALAFEAGLILGLKRRSLENSKLNELDHQVRRLHEILAGQSPPAWLGVMVQDYTAELASYTELPELRGALIVRVLPVSPAEQIGLKEGDVIADIDGKDVNNAADMIRQTAILTIGSEVKVVVYRQGFEKTFKMITQPRPMTYLQ